MAVPFPSLSALIAPSFLLLLLSPCPSFSRIRIYGGQPVHSESLGISCTCPRHPIRPLYTEPLPAPDEEPLLLSPETAHFHVNVLEDPAERGNCRFVKRIRHCLLRRYIEIETAQYCLRTEPCSSESVSTVANVTAGCSAEHFKGLIEKEDLEGMEFCLHNLTPWRAEILESPLPGTDGGEPPLFYAASRGRSEMVRLLLEAGADPKTRTRGETMTALHRAVVLGHYGVVKVLLDSGKISADVRGYEGITPIWLAAYHGRLEILGLLADADAYLEARNNVEGSRPLHVAAMRGHAETVRELIHRGAKVHLSPDEREWIPTPLSHSFQYNHSEVAKVLFEEGNTNFLYEDLYKDLRLATEQDNAELASLALELGGGMERLLGLSAENWASNVLRRFAVQEDGDEEGEDMWMEALELCGHFGFRDGAEAILRARSKRWPEEARRHAVDTAAFLAVDGDAYHSRRIIRYLHAEWEADLAALSKATVSFHEPQEYFRVEKNLAGEARTPLMAAAANGSPSKFRFLVEMGAAENQTRPSKFRGGTSALDYASCCCNEGVLEERLEVAPPPDRRRLADRAAEVTLECASESPCSRRRVLVRLLERAGRAKVVRKRTSDSDLAGKRRCSSINTPWVSPGSAAGKVLSCHGPIDWKSGVVTKEDVTADSSVSVLCIDYDFSLPFSPRNYQ